jgi:hypothetical protein
MDLAIYINELLGLRGEVNVPGVGYFAQKRIAGYYNENEKKFYPPRHEVTFDPETRDDHGLAAYISKKKNISEASAKYFIEKYTSGLKQRASEQHADIAGLGQLHYEYSTLTFKPNKKSEENDPSFYGFSPVKTHKGGGKTAVVDAASITVPPHVIKPPVDEYKPISLPVEEPKAEEKTEEVPIEVTFSTTKAFVPQTGHIEEEQHSRAKSIWIVILLIVIIVLLLFGIAYQYNPGLFTSNSKEDTTIIVKTLPAASKPDSATKKDTSSKNLAPAQTILPAVDTFAIVHYDLLGGTYKTITKTKAVMATYQKLGLQPSILTHSTGKLYHINLHTFFDRNDAIRFEDSIKKIKTIDTNAIKLIPYIPPKK